MVMIVENILKYYYEIIVEKDKIDNQGYFSYNNHLFCLYEYKRNINEIEALAYLNNIMLSKKISINKIINNIFNQAITFHNNKNYVLIMINYDVLDKANIKFIPALKDKKIDILKRNDWGKLWSNKIDYIEYQLKHFKNSYPIINSSVNYYIGMAENAISYFNMLNLSNVSLYFNHRRIDFNNLYNPLELVIDYKVRDISEYIKYSFFSGISIYDIKRYLNNLNLEDIDYLLLYVRLLYPSFYFDLYEEIINDNKEEKEINKIIDKHNEYEELLYEVYLIIKRKINLLGIDWINKKYM